MMGRSHAITGGAAFVSVCPMLQASVPELVLGTVVCTGAALLPDIDHPNATVSNTFGPITRAFSWFMRILGGGHRGGTHSVIGVGFLAWTAYQATRYPGLWYAKAYLAFLLILTMAGAVRLLKIEGYVDDVLPIPVALIIVFFGLIPLRLVPVALALGCAVHVAGDMLTKTGCPLWWPIPGSGRGKKRGPKKYALALFTTGGRVENWVIVPLTVAATVAWTIWRVAG